MGLALDDDGTILFDETTGLSKQRTGLAALEQDARSECRCEQGGNFADIYYGRNPLAWKVSQQPNDRVNDIKRIVMQYYTPFAIKPGENGKIEVLRAGDVV